MMMFIGYIICMLLLGFIGYILDEDFGFGTYLLATVVFFTIQLTSCDGDEKVDTTTAAEIVIDQEELKKDLTALKSELKTTLEEVSQARQEIEKEVKQLEQQASAELEQVNKEVTTDEDSPSIILAIVVTLVAFIIVLFVFESLWVSVGIAAVIWSMMTNVIITTTQTQTDSAPTELKQVNHNQYGRTSTEYINNKQRSRTKVYLYKNGKDLVASTSSSPDITEANVRVYNDLTLKKHTTGILYACAKNNICYPVESNE